MGAAFSLERFERADASAGIARLRLTGRWSTPPAAPAELLVGDRAFAPLPDRGPGESWRAAYLVPVRLLDGSDVTLALCVGEVGTIPLPAPVGAVAGADRDAALVLAREARDEAEALAAILRADLQEAEAARQAGAARLAQAASHAEALTVELSTTREGRDEAQALLEILRAELAERGGLKAAGEAEARVRRLEDAPVMAGDRAAGLEARVAQLEGTVLELELARATAQERADELAARLGSGG